MISSRLHELIEDNTGALSSKRLVFYVLVLLIVAATLAVYFHPVGKDQADFLKSITSGILDFLKWLGAFIVAEKPAANIKIGNNPPVVPLHTETIVTKKEETNTHV
jgi:hypothetical protein